MNIIPLYPKSQQSAIDRDWPEFFTGEPCENGHLAPRYTCNGRCSQCVAERRLARASKGSLASSGLVPKTRAEARTRGQQLYLTGHPCKHGHIETRYTSNGQCCQCVFDRNHGVGPFNFNKGEGARPTTPAQMPRMPMERLGSGVDQVGKPAGD
jgi:hypothetical protein